MWPVEFQGCLRCCDPRSLKQVLREMRRQEEKHPSPAFFQICILSPCPSCTSILSCQMHFLRPLPSLHPLLSDAFSSPPPLPAAF